MTCEFICVGTELLLGNILNTNAKYLSEKCAEYGISVFYQTVVGDNPERLEDTVRLALSRSDCIIFSGGLGPTTDDLTKETVARAFGLELVEDAKAKDELLARMNRYGRKITENNYKQALIPKGQKALYNHHGTAPGILIEKDGKTAILLPGPPRELIPMFEEYCIPYFQSRSNKKIVSVMVKLIGIGESEAAARLDDLIRNSTNPTVAPYAKTTQVHLRVTAMAENEETGKALIQPVLEEIRTELGDYIYSMDEKDEIEDVVVRDLETKHLYLSCAESFTGGMVSARLINVPGASNVLKESFVTYCDEAKIERLFVDPETIKKYGAVSLECVREMAEGVKRATGCDVGVATTGYAGPDGEEAGHIFFAVSFRGKTIVKEMHLGYDRNLVREAATIRVLALVHQILKDA